MTQRVLARIGREHWMGKVFAGLLHVVERPVSEEE